MKQILIDYFTILTENLLSTLSTPDAYLNKIALTIITIIIALLIHTLLKKLITQNIIDFKTSLKFHRIFKQFIISLSVLAILFIWIQAINALVLIALIFSAFIIIMLRGLTHNIIGYFVIKYNKYFEIGYRVEIGDIKGDVIDINPISFKLLEVRSWLSSNSNTGRIIQVPNSIIFEKSVEMVTLENQYIWHEINHTLSFDSSWQDAEEIMTEVGELYFKESILPQLDKENKYLPNGEESLHPIFALNTNDYGIVVNLRYLVDYRNGTSTRTYLQRQILNRFEENAKINLAVTDIRILSK